MNNYPYPVLVSDSDSYKNKCKFEIDIINYEMIDGHLKMIVSVDLISDYLLGLMENGFVNINFKLTSSKFSYIESYDKLRKHYELFFPINKILSIDNIKVEAYLTAKEDFEIKYNDDFSDYYLNDFSFFVISHMILGISNESVLNYNKNDPDILKIIKSADMSGKGISFKLESKYIYIYVGEELIKSYSVICHDYSQKTLVNNLLVSNALIYTFNKLALEGKSKYIECDWFKSIDQNFEYNGQTFSDFIDNIHSDQSSEIDLEEIIKAVQIFMNNSIENSIRSIAIKGE